MRKLLALILVAVFLITGCVPAYATETSGDGLTNEEFIAGLEGLNDPNLHRYVEDSLYSSLVSGLASDGFFVENVEAVYISQEYLDELAYNSQANIFFGYTLDELKAEFVGSKFIFTLGEDGTTIVEPFKDYDDTYEKVLRNVAIGTGVILVCVTVSVVTAGLGAPPFITMVFAASAKTAATFAAKGAVLGGVSAGIITGIQTNDLESALKAAAIGSSEGFKWGAITGSVSGGLKEARYLRGLKGATLGGLRLDQAAKIQRESGYGIDTIKNFSSMEQYEIYRKAGLTSKIVNGREALIRKIDLSFIDERGRTNAQRMKQGLAAIESTTNQSFDLHHTGQTMDSALAILTEAEHIQGGNNPLLHDLSKMSEIDRSLFNTQRARFWKSLIKIMESEGT